METKWYCFLFWFSYRLTLACLAHFNWCLSIYTNCAYFTLWKSYDLLWFWMHLILCSCFPQLRRENYLIVWSNLILKKCTKYPDYSFKQLYYALYTSSRSTHFTKRLMSRKEKKGVIKLDSISDDENEKTELVNSRGVNSDVEASSSLKVDKCSAREFVPEIVEEFKEAEEEQEEEEVNNDINEKSPLRPPRPLKSKLNGTEKPQTDDEVVEEGVDSNISETASYRPTWKSYVPNYMTKFLQRQNSSSPSVQSKTSNNDGTTALSRLYGRFRNNRKESSSSDEGRDELEILRPDYSNRYDCHDKSKREAREKRDRKALRERIRQELRMQLKQDAEQERKRKKVTDAIELLLQLLRMMSSFAMLIGTIRKTFIPAQFKYLKPGQHAYDNYELIILFRCTAFLDIAMFWMNVSYVYCLQWQLCCRLGCMRFIFWSTILGVVSMSVMFIPMTYVMNDLDLSWCRFMPNTTFSKYQPSW